jgi:class 3 adenylate cyclase/tetratricopeptide (TPR) repeat protein
VTLVCANCRTENPAGAKFCTECASPLARACPSCGTANTPSAKFCLECAASLAGDAAAGVETHAGRTAPRAEAVSERRLVTVLFADLVGFTPFAEERDAEEVRETLSQYFEIARQVIERFGGTVEKFIGDAVMAVWGVPTTHEDDPERAVRAALELIPAVRAMGHEIDARAGVLTGEAAVTLGATDQGMVAGDLVNTASRLQAAAAPGMVLVGESTERAAGAAIQFEPAGEHALKGKSSPVPAWRAVRVQGGKGGRMRGEGPEAPFVGRTQELQLLKDHYHAAARERRAALVSIVGPAGIGKTRLVEEFYRQTDGEAEDYWGHNGRSPAYGEGLTFWALGEMVRHRAGLAETDDEATTRAQIAAMLADHVPDDEERRWIEPAMLSLLGVAAESAPSDQLFGAWRAFFERLAETAPVVMVFEDLHWTDSGLLDFIDHLLEWSRGHPIFIITHARPELLERRPTWGAAKRHFTSVYLESLPEAAMRELLAGLVHGLPEAATRAIVDRADGVPLYAVELVRMLVSEGQLAEQDGIYVPVGEITELAVPDSLTALIAARLDGLDPVDRSLIQDASVLGQSFTLPGLAAVTGLVPEDIEGRLASLARREILSRDADPRSPERDQYRFVQSLIREVSYQTLSKRDRKSRHLAVARFLEGLDTEEIAGALAGQYLAAFENAAPGEEADALASQARVALRAASDRAATLGATEQAYRFLEQALRVGPRASEDAEMTLRAGELATAAGRYADAESLLGRARELFKGAHDAGALTRTTAAVGRNLIFAGRITEAIPVLEAASQAARDSTSAEMLAVRANLARALMLEFEYARSVAVCDDLLPAAERAGLDALVADTLVTKGTALISGGRPREGLPLVRAGGALGDQVGKPEIALRSIINRGLAETDVDPAASLESTRDGLALSRRLGLRGFAATFTMNAVEAAIVTGDWDWMAAAVEADLAEDYEQGDRMISVAAAIWVRCLQGRPRDELLAELPGLAGETQLDRANIAECEGYDAVARGDLATAAAAWREYERLVNASDLSASNRLARVVLWQRDADALEQDLESLASSGRFGPALNADRMALSAGLAALRGRPEEALHRYGQAVAECRRLKLPWFEALIGIDMATVLDPAMPEVQQAAERSRAILTELGAAPFLARLDAELARGGRATAKDTESELGEPLAIGEAEVAAS